MNRNKRSTKDTAIKSHGFLNDLLRLLAMLLKKKNTRENIKIEKARNILAKKTAAFERRLIDRS